MKDIRQIEVDKKGFVFKFGGKVFYIKNHFGHSWLFFWHNGDWEPMRAATEKEIEDGYKIKVPDEEAFKFHAITGTYFFFTE